MFNLLFEHLGPIGQFLAGLAAFLTVGCTFVAWAWHWLRNVRADVIEATTGCMQRIIKASLLREASKRDPGEYYTLDIEFEGGHRMAVPMFLGVRVLVSENIEMAVNDHTREQTELGLWCEGFGALKKHRHGENCERILVERGTVTCVETGVVYRAGETWVIEPGQWHSAVFQDCYCRVIHRPPLPTATVRPVNLDAMGSVFPED